MDHIKNLGGWTTRRKIVVIAVDDYGNVRLDSREAREALDKAGFPAKNRFDRFDTLETKQDLEALYEVLTSVKDRNGRHAVFSPYALPCNMNFEAMAQQGYKQYVPEDLPYTYEKLEKRHPKAYAGAWNLWKEGMNRGLMAPQCHGREHLNLSIFEQKISRGDADVLTALRHRSYTNLSIPSGYSFGYSAAFGSKKEGELPRLKGVVENALKAFERVYGVPSLSFTAPAQQFHPELEPVLWQNGVMVLDRPFSHIQQRPEAGKRGRREWNRTGTLRASGLRTMVRNVVFEPGDGTHAVSGPGLSPEAVMTASKAVERALNEIKVAFRCRKPAIISSHRVNYCGFVQESNRMVGLGGLKALLRGIVRRWPEVEFLSVAELANMICEVDSDI